VFYFRKVIGYAMATATAQYVRFEDRGLIDVLVVSPNTRLREGLQEKLGTSRWNLLHASGGAEALRILHKRGDQDGVLLLDPSIPDLEPGEFQAIVRERYPSTQILMLNSQTGQLLLGSSSPTPVSKKITEVVNHGGTLRPVSAAVSPDLRPRLQPPVGIKLRSMVGQSEAMMRAYTLTRMVAGRDTTVLVTGESGTGKDMIAQETHLISSRRNQPFVVVNCAAIPDALLEAELFGYTKGSFTGAVQSRIGRIHAAHGGTLFLDEIGDMPLTLQSKILRFLEQGEVQRLGGNDNLKVDVRVIAATNSDLKKRIEQQLFREDLYYRLAIFPIHLPPLRERMSDVEELAMFFVDRFRPGIMVGPDALQILQQHSWPGNVRELRNAIERATILVGDEDEIRAEHIIL
jgi:transcriptional regulator with PAS, ATPase and Fis domain